MKRVFLVGVVTTCLAACAAKGFAGPPSTEPAAMRVLVAQLIAASGTTNAVPIRDAVLKAGPAVLSALRDAMTLTNDVSFETLNLVRALTTELGGSKHGAVARGTAKEPSADGLSDGDIVVRESNDRVGGKFEVDLSYVLALVDMGNMYFQDHTNSSWRLLTDRPNGTRVEITVAFRTSFPLRFLAFPDSTHVYLTRGDLGPWDKLVLEAMRNADLLRYGKAEEMLAEAFARGCRDPLAFARWIECLDSSGDFESVPFLCHTFEKQLSRTSNCDELLNGRIAFVKSRSQLLVGQPDTAKQIVEESLVKARVGGSTDALQLLTGWHLTLGILTDPITYLCHAKANSDEVRSCFASQKGNYDALSSRAVHRYMAIGRPDMAQEFVDIIDPKATCELRARMTSQMKLARQYSNEIEGVYWIPAKMRAMSLTQEAPVGKYLETAVRDVSLRGPFRLDWTMHLPKVFPSKASVFDSAARIMLRGEDHSVVVSLNNTGVASLTMDHRTSLLGCTIGNPKKRHRFSLQVTPHVLRLDVDGQPQTIHYFAEVIDPMVATNDVVAQEFAGFGDVLDNSKKRLQPVFFTVGCGAVLEDVVVYVPSKTRVDTDAMTKTLIAMEQAIACNNPVMVTQAWQILQVAFRPVAEVNPLYKDLEKRMVALTGGSDQPWESLREAAGGSYRIYSGEWKQTDEWLTAIVSNSASGASIFAGVKMDSGELAGVIDIPPEATNASWYVHWNSIWKKDDNAFQITPGAGRFSFGVWQDPRLFMKNRSFEKTGKPIPFCIRSRGSDAALFIGKGDKPVAMASGLKNQGDAIMINFRNMATIPCRIGNLRIRTIPVVKALDAPAEMPAVPARDAAGRSEVAAPDGTNAAQKVDR